MASTFISSQRNRKKKRILPVPPILLRVQLRRRRSDLLQPAGNRCEVRTEAKLVARDHLNASSERERVPKLSISRQ